MIVPVLFSLFAVCNAQQILNLKDFDVNTGTKISQVAPYAIYVSASTDDTTLLKQINVKTTDNQVKNLYDLSRNHIMQNTGLLQPFVVNVTTEASISTTLSAEQMGKLTGFLYITTSKQLTNNHFLVYNVQEAELIKVPTDDYTIVFLNSNYSILTSQPFQSSSISAWSQTEGSSVKLYEGCPRDDAEKENSQFFSNPAVMINGKQMFFPVVEIFSLSLGAFYFKSSKGVQFVISNEFTDVNNRPTTSKITTGLYMKPITVNDRKVSIFTGHDDKLNGTIGVNVVGSVPANANFSVTYPIKWVTIPTNIIQSWSIPEISDRLGLDTINSVAGEVFVQYYMIQGNQSINPVTTTMLPGRQTTSRGIETTTKSNAIVQLFTSFIITILGARYL
ncbi:CUB_2 domain-containing protein [Caenorhabditis elegans]|uniref:CUB_2 domain-containing protein n=1 Tax=Caenorhabditis elegans TaxID=6239 RepID=Q17420_CAEEL|nr:CUB_2 domain-containing protein [Caenorhabditis elegans]CAA94877.1 CUB_2 domain-containing protein [Caenorhabditis elegans]|eukprot:NP_505648.1 Uncharacterized protein CELE_B0024.4 [Caenorhabditis elegans]